MGRRARPGAIIYARGTAEEVEAQLAECRAHCDRYGYEIRGVAQDAPGETSGWESAQSMRRPGDRIIVASTLVLPDFLESATGTLPGFPANGKGRHRRAVPPRQRRPKPAR